MGEEEPFTFRQNQAMGDESVANVVRYAHQTPEERQVETLPNYRRRLKGLPVERCQPIHAREHQTLDRSRNGILASFLGVAQQLLEEERVAAGAFDAKERQVSGGVGEHPGGVSHRNAPGGAGGDVDVVDPHPHVAQNTKSRSMVEQFLVHAIGDRAIKLQLDIFERVERENGPRDRRFRIEHAQHVAPTDIPRFRQLGVIPSMQPYHAIDDGRWAENVIGAERARTTYAFRSLQDSGARLAFGSDWFVAPPTPLEGIYAAVTRRTLDDKHPNGWVSEQKIGVEDALRAYTTGGAYASFENKEKGSLAPGKLADVVIIDRDLTRIPPETIREARIMYTMVGGRVVFDRDGTP